MNFRVSLSKIACLMSLCFVVGACGPVKGPKMLSLKQHVGYTIWGVQPGDLVVDLLRGLPSGCVVKRDTEGKNGRLEIWNEDRVLNVFTSGRGSAEVIERIGVFPAGKSLSVELSGKAILTGLSSPSEVAQALGLKQPALEYEVTRNGLKLHVLFFDGKRMQSAGITSLSSGGSPPH